METKKTVFYFVLCSFMLNFVPRLNEKYITSKLWNHTIRAYETIVQYDECVHGMHMHDGTRSQFCSRGQDLADTVQ